MISEKDILADMHTHTIFSKHAYSTVKENIEVAKKRGLKYLAVTDHYYGNGDCLDKKNEIVRIKYLGQKINPCEDGITLISSAEFNIGQEVFNFDELKNLLWKPIGYHNWFTNTKEATLNDFFDYFVDAHHKGYNAFVHIERELHKINNGKYSFNELSNITKKIVDYAKVNDIWLEVNESSIVSNDGGAAERLYSWLKYAKENKNKIFLGSDAHYCEEVGLFPNVLNLLNDIDYPKELILNCNISQLNDLFMKK